MFGGLLLAIALTQLSGLSRRWRPSGGAVASFGLAPREFVATATATALLVDVARTPVYLWQSGAALRPIGLAVAAATAGVVVGTWVGGRVLQGLPVDVFSRLVAVGVGVLGLWLIAVGS